MITELYSLFLLYESIACFTIYGYFIYWALTNILHVPFGPMKWAPDAPLAHMPESFEPPPGLNRAAKSRPEVNCGSLTKLTSLPGSSIEVPTSSDSPQVSTPVTFVNPERTFGQHSEAETKKELEGTSGDLEDQPALTPSEEQRHEMSAQLDTGNHPQTIGEDTKPLVREGGIDNFPLAPSTPSPAETDPSKSSSGQPAQRKKRRRHSRKGSHKAAQHKASGEEANAVQQTTSVPMEFHPSANEKHPESSLSQTPVWVLEELDTTEMSLDYQCEEIKEPGFVPLRSSTPIEVVFPADPSTESPIPHQSAHQTTLIQDLSADTSSESHQFMSTDPLGESLTASTTISSSDLTTDPVASDFKKPSQFLPDFQEPETSSSKKNPSKVAKTIRKAKSGNVFRKAKNPKAGLVHTPKRSLVPIPYKDTPEALRKISAAPRPVISSFPAEWTKEWWKIRGKRSRKVPVRHGQDKTSPVPVEVESPSNLVSPIVVVFNKMELPVHATQRSSDEDDPKADSEADSDPALVSFSSSATSSTVTTIIDPASSSIAKSITDLTSDLTSDPASAPPDTISNKNTKAAPKDESSISSKERTIPVAIEDKDSSDDHTKTLSPPGIKKKHSASTKSLRKQRIHKDGQVNIPKKSFVPIPCEDTPEAWRKISAPPRPVNSTRNPKPDNEWHAQGERCRQAKTEVVTPKMECDPQATKIDQQPAWHTLEKTVVIHKKERDPIACETTPVEESQMTSLVETTFIGKVQAPVWPSLRETAAILTKKSRDTADQTTPNKNPQSVSSKLEPSSATESPVKVPAALPAAAEPRTTPMGRIDQNSPQADQVKPTNVAEITKIPVSFQKILTDDSSSVSSHSGATPSTDPSTEISALSTTAPELTSDSGSKAFSTGESTSGILQSLIVNTSPQDGGSGPNIKGSASENQKSDWKAAAKPVLGLKRRKNHKSGSSKKTFTKIPYEDTPEAWRKISAPPRPVISEWRLGKDKEWHAKGQRHRRPKGKLPGPEIPKCDPQAGENTQNPGWPVLQKTAVTLEKRTQQCSGNREVAPPTEVLCDSFLLLMESETPKKWPTEKVQEPVWPGLQKTADILMKRRGHNDPQKNPLENPQEVFPTNLEAAPKAAPIISEPKIAEKTAQKHRGKAAKCATFKKLVRPKTVSVFRKIRFPDAGLGDLLKKVPRPHSA